MDRENVGRHVHRLAGERQEKPHHLRAIALQPTGTRGRGIAANAAGPDRVVDLGFRLLALGNREPLVEEKVHQRVQELLGQRLRLFELGGRLLAISRASLRVGFIEEDVGAIREPPIDCDPPRTPKELVFPCFKLRRLEDERQDPRQDPKAVQDLPLGRQVRVWERRVLAQVEKSRGDGQYQRFEVRDGLVAGSSDVVCGEEREDILGRFGQLPELEPSTLKLRGFVDGEAYASPIRIICGDGPGFLELEDTLLEDELGLGRSHGGC